MQMKFVLPLPSFVRHPVTSGTIAAVHVYLAYGHLSKLVGGETQWVHIWKGFGALFGAYVFTALASRRPTESPERTVPKENDTKNSNRVPESQCHVLEKFSSPPELSDLNGFEFDSQDIKDLKDHTPQSPTKESHHETIEVDSPECSMHDPVAAICRADRNRSAT